MRKQIWTIGSRYLRPDFRIKRKTSLTDLQNIFNNGGEILVNADIKTTEELRVTNGNKVTVTLDSNITAVYDGFAAQGEGSVLTIKGDGKVRGADNNECPYVAVWAIDGGTVNIEGGHFSVGAPEGDYNDCIYAKGGTINISGGIFDAKGTIRQADGTSFLLNLKDNYKGSSIVVTGGTFIGCDPSKMNTEPGGIVSFVAEGYESVETEPGIWTVRETETKKLLDVLTYGGKLELTESITLSEDISVANESTIVLNNNTLTFKSITNTGSLTIKEGTIVGKGIINKGKLILNNVIADTESYTVFSDNGDYESIPGQATEPVMSIIIDGGEIKSGAPYAIKNQSYGNVIINNAIIEGGISIESCIASITNSTLIANKYYGLHIYCGIVNYSDCMIEGANKDTDIYIQIKSEIGPDVYESIVNGVKYSEVDMNTSTGIIQKYD